MLENRIAEARNRQSLLSKNAMPNASLREPGKTPQQPHDHTSARLTIGKLLLESVL
jgi:hypothetical protein